MVEEYHQFYTDYKNKLFNYLRYKSGNSEVAQDIMQESFTRHFKHYGRQAVNSPALLFAIARNALVDYQRGQTKIYNTEIPKQKAAPDTESSCIAKEEHLRIHEAIETLPEQDREILILAVGGMAYKEIAAIFNLSIANVKVKIHRSRTRLRKVLNNKVQ
jgi:RNA polymerase sigma-70 factor (ECF subfamily)